MLPTCIQSIVVARSSLPNLREPRERWNYARKNPNKLCVQFPFVTPEVSDPCTGLRGGCYRSSSFMMALFNGSIHHSVHTLPPKPVFEHHSPTSSISPVHVSSRPQDDSTLNCLNYSFCIPFTILPGPDPNDIILATAGAVDNWLHPPGSPQDTPPCKLPVHTRNVEMLKKLCKEISESPDYKCRAMVVVSEPKHASFRSRKQGVVTNVWLAGDSDIVVRVKGHILQSSPVALVSLAKGVEKGQHSNIIYSKHREQLA